MQFIEKSRVKDPEMCHLEHINVCGIYKRLIALYNMQTHGKCTAHTKYNLDCEIMRNWLQRLISV